MNSVGGSPPLQKNGGREGMAMEGGAEVEVEREGMVEEWGERIWRCREGMVERGEQRWEG